MRKIAGTFLGACIMFAAATLSVNAQGNEYIVEESGVTYVVNAEAEETGEIEPLYLEADEQGRLVFTNFAELKELAVGSYDTYTPIYYEGEDILVIEEDLNLPNNLRMNFYNGGFKVPAGVTFSIYSTYTQSINIEGTLIINDVSSMQVTSEFVVTGEIMNNSHINIENTASVVGLDKIKYGNDACTLTWLYLYGINKKTLKEAVDRANAETDFHVDYIVHLAANKDFVFEESLTVPDNVTLTMIGNVTLAAGCTLDLNGRVNIGGTGSLEVLGTLNNSGMIIVRYDSDGIMTIADTGSYTGYGVINIYGVEEAEITSAVPGLDLTKYKVIKQDTGYQTYWEVHVDTGFDDVEAGAYYEAPVLWAVENGITNGHGSNTTFCPELDCTRGQVATFLWRAKGCPEPASLENPFTDVEEDAYYYKAVLWAVEQGITNGYGSETTFCPDVECTRGQVATFMWRAEGKPAVNSTQNSFTDVKSGEYYYDAVLWAVDNGVTNGYGSAETFCPDVICNRGQIVTFLYRGMN